MSKKKKKDLTIKINRNRLLHAARLNMLPPAVKHHNICRSEGIVERGSGTDRRPNRSTDGRDQKWFLLIV